VKAVITIFPANPSGLASGGTTLTFQFNPKDYTVAKSASWARTTSQAATAAGPVQWSGAGPRTIQGLQIYLDRSEVEDGNILSESELLLSTCVPTSDSVSAGNPCGPYVQFSWGNTTSFVAIVKLVSIHYTMFRPNGDPYRGTATLNLEEVGIDPAPQNPTSGGVPARRTHTVVAGESLPLIAQMEYRKPALWRDIAAANNIDDPMRVPHGTRLLIPPREEAGKGN
jgi:nucleoid-associated protein YgaU